MQLDEEVGKVAAVVPLIISRALELFVETLLTESSKITRSRNARTLTPSHLKYGISSNSQFSFLKEIVSTVPDIQPTGDDEHTSDGNPSISNLGSSKANNKPIRLTNCNPQSSASARGRGRPRKGLCSQSKSHADDEEEDNDEEEYETADEEDEEEEEEGSSCDNSSLTLSKTKNNTPSITNQLNSFGFSLSQQTEDDDYDA